MMKRIVSVLLVVLISALICGCNEESYSEPTESNQNESTHETYLDKTKRDEKADEKKDPFEGLIDKTASPAGKTYRGIDQDNRPANRTYTFNSDGTFLFSANYTGGTYWHGNWSKDKDGYILVIPDDSKNLSSRSKMTFIIYNNCIINCDKVSAEKKSKVNEGFLTGNKLSGFSGKITYGRLETEYSKNGTWKTTSGSYEDTGIYKAIDDHLIRVAGKDSYGNYTSDCHFIFIANDTSIYEAYGDKNASPG